MATHKTMAGRSRNSTIPRAIVEKSNTLFTGELEKGAAQMFRRMGTEQVDVLIEDPLICTGILREIQKTAGAVDLKIEGDKPERVTVEERPDNTFRVTRLKKTPPALPPARGFGGMSPPKKR